MKTLILMRHAKSAWDDPRRADHDRPLNKRGRAAAPLMGRWLQDIDARPQEVLCSTAARAAETWMRLGLNSDVRFTKDLYHAGPMKMAQVLRTAKAGVVLLIGHNPGIADWAQTLAITPPDHPRFFDYPTAATTVIDFDIKHWSNAKSGQCRAFATPHDLK